MAEQQQLLTVEQVAERSQVGRTKVYALIRDGEIKSVKIGRLRRVPVSAVDEWISNLAAR